jgi:hypothetical protein
MRKMKSPHYESGGTSLAAPEELTGSPFYEFSARFFSEINVTKVVAGPNKD